MSLSNNKLTRSSLSPSKPKSSTNPSDTLNSSRETSLGVFDFADIEALDPSLVGGWEVVYDRDCPVELRYEERNSGVQEVGTLEAIKAKVLLRGSENHIDGVRVELSSEGDLFFHYVHQIDEVGFRMLQEEQKLMIDMEEYHKVICRLFNSCIKESQHHLGILVIRDDGNARLDFIKNMEYKFVEILCLKFKKSSDEVIRSQIAYRYNAVKSRLAVMHARLLEINALVKVKNPSLLLQLQQRPTQSPRK